MRSTSGFLRSCEAQKLSDDTARLEERMVREDGITFNCTVCGCDFTIPCEDYEGQFDHPPSEPVCNECVEEQESTPFPP